MLANLGPFGLVGSCIVLIQTCIAAFFLSRHKYLKHRSRRLARIEPAYLELVEWAFNVRTIAASRGKSQSLPPIPESVHKVFVEDEHDDDVIDFPLDKLKPKQRGKR